MVRWHPVIIGERLRVPIRPRTGYLIMTVTNSKLTPDYCKAGQHDYQPGPNLTLVCAKCGKIVYPANLDL